VCDEDGGIRLPRNICKFLPNNTASPHQKVQYLYLLLSQLRLHVEKGAEIRKIHRTRYKKGENEKHEKRKCKDKEGSATGRNKRDRRIKKTGYKSGHERKEQMKK
jgi:hypothetical protein